MVQIILNLTVLHVDTREPVNLLLVLKMEGEEIVANRAAMASALKVGFLKMEGAEVVARRMAMAAASPSKAAVADMQGKVVSTAGVTSWYDSGVAMA